MHVLDTPAVFDALDEVLARTRSDGQGEIDAVIAWLEDEAATGNINQLVVDHIVQWNRLKQAGGIYMLEYEQYRRSRVDDWAAAGLAPPPDDMTTGVWPVAQRRSNRIGRNEPCHCGSGLKYKRCHGKS
jgi:hypothetical protein